MRVLAAYNLKGGVGKTAAAVNLAYFAALDGARTLVVDLDPQGAASYYFRVDARIKGGSEKLVSEKGRILKAIHATDYANLDIVPADFSHRNLDLILSGEKHSERRLGKILRPLEEEYEYVILDCPPGISLVSENIVGAADALVIPIIPTHLSLRAYDMLVEFCRERGYGDVRCMPFFSMLDRRRSLHLQMVQLFAATHPELLHIFIPYSSIIERMGEHQSPVATFAASSDPGRAYAALWQAVKARLHEEAAFAG